MTENSISSDRNRAAALIREGRYEEAIEIYRRLTEARPEEDSHPLRVEALTGRAFGKPRPAAG
jgi:tetratricopeptide (TPR) repeat protein